MKCKCGGEIDTEKKKNLQVGCNRGAIKPTIEAFPCKK